MQQLPGQMSQLQGHRLGLGVQVLNLSRIDQTKGEGLRCIQRAAQPALIAVQPAIERSPQFLQVCGTIRLQVILQVVVGGLAAIQQLGQLVEGQSPSPVVEL